MDFKDKLRLLRQEQNLKQADLAKLCEVSRSLVIRWEAGTYEPSLSQLKRLAEILKTSVSELVGESGEGANKVTLRYGDLSLDVPTTPEGLEFLEKRLRSYFPSDKSQEASLSAG